MCDECDLIFTEERAADSSHVKEGFTEAYAEQEKLVLTRLCECLNKIVTCGSIKRKPSLSLSLFLLIRASTTYSLIRV